LLRGEKLAETHEPVDLLGKLLAGELEWLAIMPNGQTAVGDTWEGLALLSGAFNPLHQGHRQLAQAAERMVGRPVFFELPLINADKAPLDQAEARRRAAQFEGYAPVILTRAPLFSQKACLFPRSVFILGLDTVERLVQPRFYHNNPTGMLASFEAVRAAGCRFLAAGRVRDNRFITLADIDLPPGCVSLFTQIPEKEFRVDISSTAIRLGEARPE
jgi:hypothetical protein